MTGYIHHPRKVHSDIKISLKLYTFVLHKVLAPGPIGPVLCLCPTKCQRWAAGITEASASHSTVDHGARLTQWFQRISQEAEKPNEKQLLVLQGVSNRILVECRVIKASDSICARTQEQDQRDRIPLHGCTHGEPGTGKSKVINWITRMFTEAMDWTHGVEFLNVAFQNRVALAMGGTTLHSGGDLAVGGGEKSLQSTDVDIYVVEKSAKEKFSRIQSAYESIKKQRGIA